MRHILGGIDKASEWSGKGVGMLILIIIGIMFWEVLVRYLFNAPTSWAHEISLQLFGAYCIIAGAHVLLHRQHIKIDVIYQRFSPRGRAILDSVTYLMFFLFVGTLLVEGWELAWKAVKVMEHSTTPFGPPVYPLKLLIPISAFMLLLQGLAHFTRALSMAITGKELT